MKKILAAVLSCLLLILIFSSCKGTKNTGESVTGRENIGDTENKINRVSITLPEETDAQVLTEITGGLSVNSYLTARVYLDEFLRYDIRNGGIEEYREILDTAITAFENTEKLSTVLMTCTDAWLNEEVGSDKKPTYELLSEEQKNTSYAPFLLTAYAAEDDSTAVKWAKDITEKYDKAPAGRGIRTLAEQLNTDAKRAYAQLRQAQDILNGAEYSNIADTANKAYQTAVVLKTAGTAAGLVVSVVAAPATTTLGAVINTGGMVMSGVNTVLEIGSAGSILYTNGEGNWVTEACDKTESQMAPIGQIFAIGGLSSNMSNIWAKGSDIYKSGGSLLKDPKTAEITEDVFNVLSIGACALSDYMEGGKLLAGTLTYQKDDGLRFTLMDTLLGDESGPAVDKILSENSIGLTADEVKSEDNMPEVADTQEIPADIGRKLLEANAGLDPRQGSFDVNAYVNELQKLLGATEETKTTSAPRSDTSQPPDLSDGGEIPTKAEILGTYVCKLTLSNDFEHEYPITFEDGGEGQIIVIVDEEVAGIYDAATATVQTFHEDSDVNFVFRKHGTKITVEYYPIFKGDWEGVTGYGSGVKQ